jgi:catechol 2,3-dioxygenase-like lactoylglutathione lyase family enzyme
MLQSLDHVLVAVRDLEAATRATAALLGRRPSWRGEHPREGTANTLFRLENTYLELIAPAGEGRTAIVLERWLEGHGEGPLGLAFGTDDAEASRLALAALDPEPVEKGLGRDVDSGAFREWRRVGIPLAHTRGVLLFAIEHTSPPESLPPAPLATEEAAAVHALDHAVSTGTASACAWRSTGASSSGGRACSSSGSAVSRSRSRPSSARLPSPRRPIGSGDSPTGWETRTQPEHVCSRRASTSRRCGPAAARAPASSRCGASPAASPP